jgi:hypothetical protein
MTYVQAFETSLRVGSDLYNSGNIGARDPTESYTAVSVSSTSPHPSGTGNLIPRLKGMRNQLVTLSQVLVGNLPHILVMSGYLPPHSKEGPQSKIYTPRNYELEPADIYGGTNDVQEYRLYIPEDVKPSLNKNRWGRIIFESPESTVSEVAEYGTEFTNEN